MKESLLRNPVRGVPVIRVREQGSGPALLLVNGLSRPLESWDPLASALDHRRVISFDAPGIGRSPRALFPLSIGQLSSLVSVILDACGIHDADVLGYSHGGAVAQQLTLDAPDRVSHLILAATTPGLGAPVGDVTALIDTPTNPAWPTPDPVSVAWRVAALASWTSLPYLARITSPTLVVVGEGDRVIPRLTTALFGRGVPNAEVVSIDADHDLQTPEATLLLAPIIERFLSS